MTATFLVEVTLDLGHVEQTARLRGRAIEYVRAEALADLDARLHDGVRFRDGVNRVTVRMLTPHVYEPGVRS